MTGNSSAAGHGTFDENLLACVEDINKLLAKLGGRYDMTVIMSALTAHLGSAMKVLMLRKICDARRAQQDGLTQCAYRTLSASAFPYG